MKVTAQEITGELFNRLWESYLKRVSYAKKCVELVKQRGGNVIHDHIAIRTLNTHTGEQPEGIRAIKHIIQVLGYQPVENYQFPKRKINAVHFEYPDDTLPKIFVSQLEVELLPLWAQEIIRDTVKETPYLLSDKGIKLLQLLKTESSLPAEAAQILVDDLIQYFRRPWDIPYKENVLKINDISQYAAWVMLYGNSVNHFTASVNQQNVGEWPDLETTCNALNKAGIPMKDEIEGEKGGKLQQSATLAIKEEVEVRTEDGIETIPWPFAYYEFVQRGYYEVDGRLKLFNGFLCEHDRHLFDMTRTREN